ncbi:hypothetical protein PA598K_01030 [Paenibacillus sp. 598K]|uniref:hypothetical protein n=1 Tax=Paenibacillus sp. 598K TaxID=1117987 RepID=UPI000FF9B56E|nr:hypothetical protein [Paenibacillus sp. 598K]GBF72763.1 hypothetical protein PA598K_01030 [Paenibacillus sp. 598K]
MRIWKTLLLSVALALTATYLLASLPESNAVGSSQPQEAQVFLPSQATSLDFDNVVDVLGSESWRNGLKRVVWSHAELAVDYAVPRQAAADDLNADLLALLKLAMVQLDNVERVRVRFVETASGSVQTGADGKRPALLLAADVRRTDSELARYLANLSQGDMLQPQWRELFRLRVTPEWERRFGPLVD